MKSCCLKTSGCGGFNRCPSRDVAIYKKTDCLAKKAPQVDPKCDLYVPEAAPQIQKVSVSAQRSDDGFDYDTVALRVVNHAASARDVVVTLDGAAASNEIEATAESLFSNDLQAENTAADVNNVAPEPLQGITTKGQTVSMSLPPSSFTIVVMKMKNSRGEAPIKEGGKCGGKCNGPADCDPTGYDYCNTCTGNATKPGICCCDVRNWQPKCPDNAPSCPTKED